MGNAESSTDELISQKLQKPRLYCLLQTEWPAGYFECTYGAFRDDPLVRAEQGVYDVRDKVSITHDLIVDVL